MHSPAFHSFPVPSGCRTDDGMLRSVPSVPHAFHARRWYRFSGNKSDLTVRRSQGGGKSAIPFSSLRVHESHS